MAKRKVRGQVRISMASPSNDPRILVPQRSNESLEPYRAPVDPMMGDQIKKALEYVRLIMRDQTFLPLAADWDVYGLQAALNSHRLGNFDLAADLVDELLSDDRVTAAMGQRLAGLFSVPAVHTASKLATTEEADAWEQAWERLDSDGSFADSIRYGVTIGCNLHQILWDTSVTPWMPRLKQWHPRNIRWDSQIRRYVVQTRDGVIPIEPGNGTWFLYTPYGQVNGWLRGVIRSIAKPWLVRHYAWRDWARFNERHGLPLLLGKVPAMASAQEKEEFEEDLLNLGEEAVAMLPQGVDGQGFDLDMLEAMATGWETFKGAITAADNAIVLSLVWQNITTEGGVAGNYASTQVAEKVKHSAITFDEKSLSSAVYWQLARPFFAFNYGDPNKASRTRWKLSNAEAAQAMADVLYKVGLATQAFSISRVDLDPAMVVAAMGISIPDGWATRRVSETAMGAPIKPVEGEIVR